MWATSTETGIFYPSGALPGHLSQRNVGMTNKFWSVWWLCCLRLWLRTCNGRAHYLLKLVDLKIISRLLKLGQSTQIFYSGGHFYFWCFSKLIYSFILLILLFVFFSRSSVWCDLFLPSSEHTPDQSRHCWCCLTGMLQVCAGALFLGILGVTFINNRTVVCGTQRKVLKQGCN